MGSLARYFSSNPMLKFKNNGDFVFFYFLFYLLKSFWLIVIFTRYIFRHSFYAFLSCVHDYLELRDGSTSNAGLISLLCGNTRPSTQHSTSSSMLLRFRTDNSVTHKGFKAKYSIGMHITVITHSLKMVFQIQELVLEYGLKVIHKHGHFFFWK